MNGDNNGHDEAFTDVKLEVPASTPTGDQPSYDRGERIKSEIGNKINTVNRNIWIWRGLNRLFSAFQDGSTILILDLFTQYV